MTWRRWLALDLALLGAMVLASRLALLLHEGLGHGLVAWLLGAKHLGMRLSLFGGGFVTAWPVPVAGFGRSAFYLGGLAVNVATGLAAWWIAERKLRRGGLPQAFLLMLAAGSAGQALWYVSLGFWHGEGDPMGFLPAGSAPPSWAWLIPVPLLGILAWGAGRSWLGFLAAHVDLATVSRRLGWSLATGGVAVAAYFGLWGLTWDSKVDRTLVEQKVEREVARRLAATPAPTPTPTPAVSAIPTPLRTPAPVEVVREQVRNSLPFPWAPWTMGVAALLGGALSLRRPPRPAEPATPGWAWALWPLLAALAVGAIAAL